MIKLSIAQFHPACYDNQTQWMQQVVPWIVNMEINMVNYRSSGLWWYIKKINAQRGCVAEFLFFYFFANVAGQNMPKKEICCSDNNMWNTQQVMREHEGVFNTSGNRNKLCQKLAMFLCLAANDWTYAVNAKMDPSGSKTTN